MRSFRDVTKDAFNTVELPSETAARKRRSLTAESGTNTQLRGPLKKVLNLHTYKFHALGDYVQSIRVFGTVDSYSTQLVCDVPDAYSCSGVFIIVQGEFAHRVVKRLFALTNKKDAVTQIATKYRREARSSDTRATRVNRQLDLEQTEAVAPELHHHISHSRNSPLNIKRFLHLNNGDPAKKVSFSHCQVRLYSNHNLEGLPPKTSPTSSCTDVRPGL